MALFRFTSSLYSLPKQPRVDVLYFKRYSNPWILLLIDHSDLNVPEIRVRSITVQELFVCSLLNNLATIENDDPVGVADSRESMGDDERRSICGHLIERPLDTDLGPVVHVARRLVEHKHRRVREEDPSDGEPLALATRQLPTGSERINR